MNNTIGIIGGSYNPIGIHHLIIGQTIINDLQLKKIIYVPVSDKYEKKCLKENVTELHRIEMLKLAIKSNDKFELNLVEIINKEKQLKTIDTLQILSKQYSSNVALIIGSDNLIELPTWYKAETLLKKYKIIVVSRGTNNIQMIINSNRILKHYKNSITEVNVVNTDISSTLIRNNIKNNKSIDYLTPPEVIEYIYENSLYK